MRHGLLPAHAGSAGVSPASGSVSDPTSLEALGPKPTLQVEYAPAV